MGVKDDPLSEQDRFMSGSQRFYIDGVNPKGEKFRKMGYWFP